LRVVLVTMHAGTKIPPHRTDGPITVHAIEGTLTVSSETQKVSLRPGQLLMLHAGVYHIVEAARDCAFLLTLSVDSPHPFELVEAGG
jgi:quercetin dioxygenase-like cupin family protein